MASYIPLIGLNYTEGSHYMPSMEGIYLLNEPVSYELNAASFTFEANSVASPDLSTPVFNFDAGSSSLDIATWLVDRVKISPRINNINLIYGLETGISLTGSMSVGGLVYSLLEEILIDDTSYSASSSFNTFQSDVITLSEAISESLIYLTSDSFSVTGANEVLATIFKETEDNLLISSSASNRVDINSLFTESLTLAGLMYIADLLSLSDTITVSDIVSSLLTFNLQEDSITIADTSSGSYLYAAIQSDSVTFTDTSSYSIIFETLAEDGLVFLTKLPLEDSDYEVWVLNKNTFAASQYTNYPFNSYMNIDNKVYGVSENGIYLLDSATTDSGSGITGSIKTGYLDFGTLAEKNVPRGYLYIRNDDTMLLKTISDKHGERIERWYQIDPREGEVLQQRRRVFSRGVKAVRWAFELTNANNADFDLRGFEVIPVVFRKRP